MDCGALPDFANGMITLVDRRTTHGAFADYVCKDNYTLVGDTRRRCGDGGIWSGHQPQCLCKLQINFSQSYFSYFSIFLFFSTNPKKTVSWNFYYIFINIWTVMKNFLKSKCGVESTLQLSKETRVKKKLVDGWHDSGYSTHPKSLNQKAF